MTAQGRPAVRLPIRKEKRSNRRREIPPFAIRIPDRINMGTASMGKLLSALNMARTI